MGAIPIFLLLWATLAGTAVSVTLYQVTQARRLWTATTTVPFTTHLAAGAAYGLGLWSTAAYLCASHFGLTPAAIACSCLLLTLCFAPLLLSGVRNAAAASFHILSASTIRRFIDGGLSWGSVAAILVLVMHREIGMDGFGNLYTGLVNTYGDLPFHLHVVNGFLHGASFPPQDPAYAGTRFTYPFLADFLSATLMRAGASLSAALLWPAVLLALAMLVLLQALTLELTNSRLAARLAPFLLLASGAGLGWLSLFNDWGASARTWSDFLLHLPHDYTLTPSGPFRLGNLFTTAFVPERSFLMGVPLVLGLLLLFWRTFPAASAITPQPVAAPSLAPPRVWEQAGWLLPGALAGLLPLLHTYSLCVLAGAAAVYALLQRHFFPWLWFAAGAAITAIPELLWMLHGSRTSKTAFVAWHLGWDHGKLPVAWFWLLNTGIFIPLLVWAMLLRTRREKPGRAYRVSTQALQFYAPFAGLFLLANLVRLAPWIWDNIKVLLYWYIASLPFVALAIATLWRRKGMRRAAAVMLLTILSAGGALDLFRVASRQIHLDEFDQNGRAIARDIQRLVPANAIVLHAPVPNSPVALSGRRTLLGYPGTLWSRGLPFQRRLDAIHAIYSGPSAAAALLAHYRIHYVLLGPQETSFAPVDQHAWLRQPVIAQEGPYRLLHLTASSALTSPAASITGASTPMRLGKPGGAR